MQARVSFIFQAGSLGWSEQWYRQWSDSLKSLALDYVQPAWVANFLAPRASGVIFKALRCNDVANPRSSFLLTAGVDSGGFGQRNLNTGEQPQVAALGYGVTGTGKHRPVMLRGLIDSQVNRDASDNWIPDPALMTALQQWANATYAKSHQVQILVGPTQQNPDRQVVQMAPSATDPGITRITYDSAISLVQGLPIIMHQIPRGKYPGYQGPLPALNVTATTVDVPVEWRLPGNVAPLRTTTVRHVEYTYEVLIDVRFNDLRTKRTGRPINLPRGRRPAVHYRSR
jgi:hypothetical protein